MQEVATVEEAMPGGSSDGSLSVADDPNANDNTDADVDADADADGIHSHALLNTGAFPYNP